MTNLFNLAEAELPAIAPSAFGGATYDAAVDHQRLCRQAQVVFDLMADGEWRTLSEIEEATGFGQASISARLRDFRKARFGGFNVKRRRRGAPPCGLFEYQLLLEKE